MSGWVLVMNGEMVSRVVMVSERWCDMMVCIDCGLMGGRCWIVSVLLVGGVG